MEVLALAVLERKEMVVGREPIFGFGDVEANHAVIAAVDCGAGNLKSVIEMVHSRADHPDGEVGSRRTGGEANEHGIDDLVKAETLFGVEFGREPDLGIDDAVGGEVFGALTGNLRGRRCGLHHCDGVRECLEVQREILPVRPSQHPGRQRVGIGCGEAGLPDLVGEFDDCCRTQATVEVVVEQDLGCTTDSLERGWPDVRAWGRALHANA